MTMYLSLARNNRLFKPFMLPKDRLARTMLLAMRCDYVDGSYRPVGLSNTYTVWLWRKFVAIWPGERSRMQVFLTKLRVMEDKKGRGGGWL